MLTTLQRNRPAVGTRSSDCLAVAESELVDILFGWGIGIVGHYVSVFRGHSYVDRKAEEEYQRLKKEQEGR